MQSLKTSFWAPMLVAGLLLIAVLLAGCAQASAPQEPAQSGALGAPASPSAPAPELVMSDNKTGYDKTQAVIVNAIADGTYMEPVSYVSPGGIDELVISLAVKDDIITSVALEAITANNISSNYVANYNKNIQPLVIGKKINELNLPANVAGSSLTNAAFKQYVEGLIEKY